MKKVISSLLCVLLFVTVLPIANTAYAAYSMLFPVKNGKLAYYYGYSESYGGNHAGIDIHSNGNDNIYAAAAGKVVAVANSCPHVSIYPTKCEHYNTFGNYIKIQHTDGTYAYYGHLKQNTIKVSVGSQVVKGQHIATMGSSGYSSGKHLHFEMRLSNGSTTINVNPTVNGGSVSYAYSGYSDEPHTTHNYSTYVYYWAAHPHYKCYECSCGEVKANTSETTFVSTCKECNPTVTYKTITSGNYYIKNKGSGGYLNVAYGKDEDVTAIHTHEFGNWDSQVYNIYPAKNGYEMMPLCSKTRVVNPYCTTVVSGKTVNLYSKTNESSQWWKFQPVNDGYVIRNVQNPNVCLTPYNYGMIVSEYTGADNQIWYLEKACLVKYDASGGTNAPASKRVRAGYKTAISAQRPTKLCHTFMGWSTAKNDTIAAWDEKIAVTIYDDTTLYAVWKEGKHTYKTTTKAATTSKNGSIVKKCSSCSKVASNTTIKYAKTFKLSTTSYTYTSGVKTPTVTVKDSSGKTLKKNTDYTVSYAKGRKYVGTYKVTIKMKGNYSGTKTLIFKIVPRAASVNKLTAKKKALSVKLNRSLKQSTGYEIQYSTSKKFTKSTTKTKKVSSYKTTSVTLKSLKAKKTYYVRVRTYKFVNGKKYYSNWSSYKSKKTK